MVILINAIALFFGTTFIVFNLAIVVKMKTNSLVAKKNFFEFYFENVHTSGIVLDLFNRGGIGWGDPPLWCGDLFSTGGGFFLT